MIFEICCPAEVIDFWRPVPGHWRGSQIDHSFRALSGRLKFTVRCHKFNNDSLFATARTLPHVLSRRAGASRMETDSLVIQTVARHTLPYEIAGLAFQ